jgi:hypothetical protein
LKDNMKSHRISSTQRYRLIPVLGRAALPALLLAACVDDGSSPVDAAPGAASLAQASAQGLSGPDMVFDPRFELELDVDGALKPGNPIHLTVRGSARYATQDAEVRLVLPEVAAAERSSWDVVDIPVGEATTPHLRTRKAFEAGETFRERATVTIPEPGYYYVVATVIQHSDDPRVNADGGLIGSGAGRELWLWVDEHGGRVTERFDPTLFPEGTRRVRGPLGSEKKPPRVRHGEVVITCSLIPTGTFTISSSPCPQPDSSLVVNPPTQPPATAAVTVTYTDAGTGTVRPVADAWLAWKVVNTTTGGVVASAGAYTTASGMSPTIDCQGPTTERRLEVTVHAENRKAEVKSYINYNPDRTQIGQYFGSCGGSIPITADNQQAHLFMNLNKTYDGHARVFGQNPPTIMRAGLYPVSSYGSRYDWGANEVHIEPAWDHIWREQGIMVAAHEWGHLWQDQYLYQSPATDGLRRYYNSACPNPHPPGQYTNFGCAVGEAFADWYAVLVRESDMPGWRRDLEENRLHLLYCGQKCTEDGSIVQGAVHAFLWDITDPAYVEGHDRIQRPAADVVASIKSCSVSIDRVTYRPYTGIDHLIWCFERRFPYQVRLQKTYGSGDTLVTFFNTRPANQWANDARGFTVANLSDDFRRLWLVNLYSRRQDVGTIPILRSVEPLEPTLPPPPEPTDPTCGTGTKLQCPY